jgi:hypothetical protein
MQVHLSFFTVRYSPTKISIWFKSHGVNCESNFYLQKKNRVFISLRHFLKTKWYPHSSQSKQNVQTRIQQKFNLLLHFYLDHTPDLYHRSIARYNIGFLTQHHTHPKHWTLPSVPQVHNSTIFSLKILHTVNFSSANRNRIKLDRINTPIRISPATVPLDCTQ